MHGLDDSLWGVNFSYARKQAIEGVNPERQYRMLLEISVWDYFNRG